MRKSPYRIKSSQEIQTIRKNGRSISDERLAIVMLPNDHEFSRAAVLASKAVGGAVQRNRCKRLLRARLANTWVAIKPGYDILVIARKPLLLASPSEIDQSFEHLVARAGLIEKQENDRTNIIGRPA